MWQTITDVIISETGIPFKIKHKQQITGGDIHLSYWISNYQQNYFIKLNSLAQQANFEAETYSLQQLKASRSIYVPEVIASGKTLDKSFLVLEYLAFDTPSNKDWYCFGERLADMHKTTIHGKFGWQHDNFIGLTPQPNKWQSNWRTFFAEQRIGWQLQLLAEKSIRFGDIEHLVQVCHDALLHHSVKPCLVHGDLWQGNAGFIYQAPVIYDPACYYGDREVDLAMTELFEPFPQAFYQGYQENYPLPPHYEQRKLIYNLYHILNHANLFGGDYIEQSKAMIARVLSLH